MVNLNLGGGIGREVISSREFGREVHPDGQEEGGRLAKALGVPLDYIEEHAEFLGQLRQAQARLLAAAQILEVPHDILLAVLDQLVAHPELESYYLSKPVRDYLGLPSPAGHGWETWPPVPTFCRPVAGLVKP